MLYLCGARVPIAFLFQTRWKLQAKKIVSVKRAKRNTLSILVCLRCFVTMFTTLFVDTFYLNILHCFDGMHASGSSSSLLFLGNGSFRFRSTSVRGIHQARENSKQNGASAVMYFNISCYSGAYTADSIEVKKIDVEICETQLSTW